MSSYESRALIRARLAEEMGTLRRAAAARRVALVYPSPYHVGMSSLGFQAIYRAIHDVDGWTCERAFLPDDGARRDGPLYTYESESPAGAAHVVAFSIAYELELTGMVDCLELAGLPALAEERSPAHPLVVAGGPLTFSNPLPLGPFVDAVVLGEAE
jgi:radical SAM superfamily enzyme YgiQ (UPF0313 family)